MIRTIASRVTGTAVSTARFAAAIPLGVARSVLERVTRHGSDDAGLSETPERRRPPQREAQEQAAQTAASSPGASTSTSTPAETRGTAGTAKAGVVGDDDGKPDVVLAVDAPPEVIEPPVDVVGEAIAAEQEQQAQAPPQPQPVRVNEEPEVVYSTTSDDD